MGATFYFLGFQYRRLEGYVNYHTILVAISFSVISLIGWYGKGMSMFCSFSDTFFYIPIALLGIYACYGLSYQLDKYRLKTFFYYIGKHTMPILALHFLAFKTVGFLIILFYSLPMGRLSEIPVVSFHTDIYWGAYTIVGIVLPLASYYIYSIVKRVIT